MTDGLERKKNNNRTDGVRHRFASARQKGGIGKENERTKIGILNLPISEFEYPMCVMSDSKWETENPIVWTEEG